MFKFIGKTLAGVVLTKDAQAAVGKALQPKPASGAAAKPVGAKSGQPVAAASSARAKAPAAMQPQARGAITPERQALIQNALKVRAAKTKVIGELSDEARANLVGIALIGLLKADQKDLK
jgi:hypothetical protein